jgi:streptogramin lyase
MGRPQRSFRLPGVPTAIAARPGSVWVAFGQSQTGLAQAAGKPQTGPGGVVKLDPASGSQLSMDSETDVPTALLVARGTVWVALAGDSNTVDRIDETSGQSLSSSAVSVGNQPTDLAFGDGAVWALNYSDATVMRIDPASGRVTATITFAGRTDPDRLAANTPIRLAVTPGTLWVTDAATNTLRRLADR